MALTLVAAYDIREDDRRARVAAYLQSWGNRVQRSVYLLRVPEDELDEVMARADAMIAPETDGLIFLRQCRSCWEDRHEHGQLAADAPDVAWIVM